MAQKKTSKNATKPSLDPEDIEFLTRIVTESDDLRETLRQFVCLGVMDNDSIYVDLLVTTTPGNLDSVRSLNDHEMRMLVRFARIGLMDMIIAIFEETKD
jgi:hypothetical protein